MSTEHLSEVAELQRICENGCLPRAKEEFERENVGMDEDGHLVYSDTDTQREAELSRKRKELVLGMNGFEQHTLEEANRIVSEASCSPLSQLGQRIQSSLR